MTERIQWLFILSGDGQLKLEQAMICPYGNSEIGIPYVRMAHGTCSRCSGKITYAFSGKKVALLFVPSGFLCWWAAPLLGGGGALFVFLALILLPAIRLEKWF